MSDTPNAVVGQPLPHDSARGHVTGAAPYIDDLPEPAGTLHMALVLAPAAKGRITGLALEACRAHPGVVAVLTAGDCPGVNDCSPSPAGGDRVLAAETVAFHGEAVAAVLAESRLAARLAARKVVVSIDAQTPVVDVAEAMPGGATVLPDYAFLKGDAEAGLASAPRRVDGQLRIGGQEHFYLEGQIALAIPDEAGGVIVQSSTQYPNEVQHVVARVLGLPHHAVTVICRRMGGGFGGKESQASQWAALAALGAWKTGRACKLRLDRDDDFILTGKRHDFLVQYATGFDDDGRLRAQEVS
mgnify:CR=1 FL=1